MTRLKCIAFEFDDDINAICVFVIMIFSLVKSHLKFRCYNFLFKKIFNWKIFVYFQTIQAFKGIIYFILRHSVFYTSCLLNHKSQICTQ